MYGSPDLRIYLSLTWEGGPFRGGVGRPLLVLGLSESSRLFPVVSGPRAESAIDGQFAVGVAGEELSPAPGPCDVQIRDRVQHEDRERYGGPAAYVVEADVGVGRCWEQAVQLVHHVV
jgi:hypothetical protein